MPIANRPGAASASDATDCGEARRRAGVRRHDRRAEAQARLPRRRQRERRERVRTVGLGRPDVGVAEVGELVQLLAVAVQRSRQRHGHPWSDRQRDHRQLHRLVAWRDTRGHVTLPEPHDAALAGGRQQRPVLGEHVHEPVAEAAARPRAPGCRAAPTPSAPACRRAACCRGCCRRRGRRAPDRRPSARSRRGPPAWSASTPSITSGIRAHITVWPSPRVPSRVLEVAALGQPLVEPIVDGAVDRHAERPRARTRPATARRASSPTARPGRTGGGRAPRSP